MSKLNDLGKDKYFANRGVERNKAPIANLIYKVELIKIRKEANPSDYEQYKFKDLGYISLLWTKSKADKSGQFQWNFHGFVTPAELKDRIGEKQWAKFCQGKREFIIQRRIDGKNVGRKNG